MRKLLALFLLVPTLALADTNNTNSRYQTTVGSPANGVVILQSTDGQNSKAIDVSNPLPVAIDGGSGGTVSGTDSDNAVNSTSKIPVIPCVANNAAPTWTEGHEVPCSVTLSGDERTVMQGYGVAGTPAGGVVSVQGVAGGTAVPVSAASLPLPTGAATAANQTNVQSAPGTPQTIANTIQGNAAGVPVPVTGTVTTSPPAAVTPVVSTAVESGHILKATPGSALAMDVFSTSGGLVMLFNSTTVPADGAVTPLWCLPISANSWVSRTWIVPLNFTIGISVAVSTGTNCASKTAQSTAWITAQVQ